MTKGFREYLLVEQEKSDCGCFVSSVPTWSSGHQGYACRYYHAQGFPASHGIKKGWGDPSCHWKKGEDLSSEVLTRLFDLQVTLKAFSHISWRLGLTCLCCALVSCESIEGGSKLTNQHWLAAGWNKYQITAGCTCRAGGFRGVGLLVLWLDCRHAGMTCGLGLG